MSLRVWLPLNGNLENHGSANVTATEVGTTIEDQGKIGKCYKFNTSPSYLLLPKEAMTSFENECSVCFWLKILSWKTGWDTFFQAGLGGTPWDNYIFGFLRINSSKCAFSISNGGSSYISGYCSSSINFQLNIWYHITLIYKTGHCLLYINGQLDRDYSTTVVPDFSKITTITIGIGNNKTSYQTNCLMNDFRIYDHALSQQEIKKVAQGLILHYPLNDSFIEETTNLITTEDCLSSTCFNGATKKYGYGTSTDMYKVTGVFQGKKATKLYMGTSGLPARPYPYFSNLFVSDGTNSPAYKTLSFDYYGTIGTYITPYKLGNGNGICTWTNDKTEVKTGSYTNSGNIPVVPNKWNHITMVLHGITEADAQWGYIILGDQHTSNTNNYWLFANAQIEVKDHETGYAGVGKSRIKNIVYDISGNLYNGIENNITYSTDSPLYKGSFVLNGSNSYIKNDNNDWTGNYPEQLTVSIWAYSNNWSGVTNGGRIWSCTESGGFNIQGGASGYWRFPVYCATNSEHTSHAYKYNNSALKISNLSEGWHMITWVYTTTEHKVYLDGQLINTYEIQTYGIKFNTGARLFLGCEASGANPSAPYFNGKLSDFRIYATALSADDIKELYEYRS